MTKPRTLNPAVRISGFAESGDLGELFLGTRLDTLEAVAFRLTASTPSPRRPTFAMFRKGAKDPKMKTPPGGVIQFDSARLIADAAGAAVRTAEGRPVYEASWATLLAKDTVEHPVLAAWPTRLIELAATGANGRPLARADIVDTAQRHAFDAKGGDLAAWLEGMARRTVLPGAVEERNRHVLVRWRGPAGEGGAFADIDGIGDAVAAIALAGASEIAAAPGAQIFVGTVAKDNTRRIAPYAKFQTGPKPPEGWPPAGFVRCNLALGRHRLDAQENEIPDETAQRFLVACTFAEFPEPAAPAAIDIFAKAADGA